jgi:catecholate siderophore receptor
VADAMVSYQVNKNLDLQLNVFNLFNKKYMTSMNKLGFRYTPGLERSARLTANFKF